MSQEAKGRRVSGGSSASGGASAEPVFTGPTWGAVAALSAGAALTLFGANASAATIIQDGFTAGSGSNYGASIRGTAPNLANAPGGTWTTYTSNDIRAKEYKAGKVISNSIAGAGFATDSANAGSATGLTLGASNTGSLQIQAHVFYNTITGDNYHGNTVPSTLGSGSFTVLGFNSTTGGSASGYGPLASPTAKFTGLQVLTNGSLQELVNGATVGSPIAFVGTYTPFTSTLLSYQIDSTTGAISNVSFGSSAATYNFSTSGAFVNADTANLEIGGLGKAVLSTDANAAWFTDVTVTGTPEPSSIAILLGGVGFGLLRRRARRRAVTPKTGK